MQSMPFLGVSGGMLPQKSFEKETMTMNLRTLSVSFFT